MLGRLFNSNKSSKSSQSSPFKNTKELNSIAELMTLLHEKEIELLRDAKLKKDPESIDQKKHDVVAEFIAKGNALIATFNISHKNREPDLQQIVDFAHDFNQICNSTLDKHEAILKEPRNNNQKNANIASQVVILGTAIGAALFQTFPTGVAIVGAGYAGSEQFKETTGTSNDLPASFRWIKELQFISEMIKKNVKARIANDQADAPKRPSL